MQKTERQKLAAVLKAVSVSVDVPTSALKALRGSRRQADIALKRRVSQVHISELEVGKKSLTPRVSAKLVPVLGSEAKEQPYEATEGAKTTTV